MSSTEPKCPIGIRFGFALGLLVTISVSINAGAMAFTVIPSLTPQCANQLVNRMVAFRAVVSEIPIPALTSEAVMRCNGFEQSGFSSAILPGKEADTRG